MPCAAGSIGGKAPARKGGAASGVKPARHGTGDGAPLRAKGAAAAETGPERRPVGRTPRSAGSAARIVGPAVS
jgi:hypothetical protein